MHDLWRLCLLILVGGLLGGPAHAQGDRRDRREPELIVEPGGRMGACDALTFTADGKFLLAAGDDKVVRVWPVTDKGLDTANAKTLRWSIWREQRGSIYALALSPDEAGRFVAVAGLGARVGTVAVLDRLSGQVLHSLTDPKGNDRTIRALAFAPSGRRLAYAATDGSVWLWDLAGKEKNDSRLLGKHAGKGEFNRVRLVEFLAEDRLLSVAEDGQVLEWDAARPGAAPVERFQFNAGHSLYRVVLSPKRDWLAAATQGPPIAVRSLDGKQNKDITLPAGHVARAVAFDAKGERLLASVGVVPADAAFYKETDNNIFIYDLTQTPPKATAGPPHSYHAEAVAFHPSGARLAVAGGPNHEVILWDVARPREPVGTVRGLGTCLWGVVLSDDGRYLGFSDLEEPDPRSPNRRARGPGRELWRVFDLQRRKWAAAADLKKPVEPLDAADGWSVAFSRTDPYVWYAVGPDGKKHELPLNRHHDGMPQCYTFLKADKGKPTRLVVGHYWGLSVIELTKAGARRTRLCTGHQGEVMAVAASAKGDWLVSASRDQTVAAWSLADWDSQPELGARFGKNKNGAVVVEAVDYGGPAWEAGLIEGDEVALFAFNKSDFLYDPGRVVSDARRKEMGIKQVGDAADCLERLRRPVPGLEFYFEVKRGGRPERVQLLTTVRQRPLWRFFPASNKEWVLWMWRNYYYDTSTSGDFLIGWHVNALDTDQAPAFYRAEQFRKHFHRPDVIDKLLGTRDVQQAVRLATPDRLPPRFDGFEPPAVRLDARTRVVKDSDLKVTLTASPRGDNPDHLPQRVELWVNDCRYPDYVWDAGGRRFEKELVIPRGRLRAGANELTLQTYNRLGGRSEASVTVTYDRSAPEPRLFGLAVGINDYSKAEAAPGGKRFLGNLRTARKDAEAITGSLLAQKGKLYEDAKIELVVDQGASRKALLDALKDLAGRVRPDDHVVLFLAGHGDFLEEKAAGNFVFCLPNYDRKRFADTGVTGQVLYEALAEVPGRKLVILDACHSGEAAANPIRSLTPGGKGPIILAACDRGEFSFENDDKFGHGLYTYAVLEALGAQFDKADADHDRRLTPAEVHAYAQARLPELLKEIKKEGDEQNPTSFPPVLEAYPIARK